MDTGNFLTAIEATKGENLTSAVLAYLLGTDSRLLSSFLSTVDRCNFDIKDSIVVETEFGTKSDHYHDGRLDLMVELPGRLVLGVENKLWAQFQDDQPAKYCNSISQRAVDKSITQAFLLVLAPEDRQSEVMRELNKIPTGRYESLQCKFLSWETLLDRLKNQLMNQLDQVREVGFLIAHLDDYYRRSTSWFEKPFSEVFEHLNENTGQWNEYQDELVKRLWGFFPDSGARIEKSQGNYIGYRFYRKYEEPETEYVYGWYGFVNPMTQFDSYSGNKEAKFIIATDLKDKQLFSDFPGYVTPVKLAEKNWSKDIKGWIVEIGDDWSKPGDWEQNLRPILDVLNKALPQNLRSRSD